MSEKKRDSDGFPIPTGAHQVEILARAFRIEARVAQHIRNWDVLKSELEGRLLLGSKSTKDRNRRWVEIRPWNGIAESVSVTGNLTYLWCKDA